MEKLIVISDTHGYNEILNDIVMKHPDCIAYIHCGDLEDDPMLYSHYIVVRGNNDFYGSFKKEVAIRIGKHRIYVTHSHRVYGYDRNKILARIAKENDCDMVFYGHTHRRAYDIENGVHLLNPGSPTFPRGGTKAGYAIVYLDGNNIKVEFEDVEPQFSW